MFDYAGRYEEYRAYAEREIEAYLDSLKHIPEPLYSAMKYAVLGGGKRIRPVMALHGAELACGDKTAGVFAAIAVELVHCYSLVHDDMPCMDNDTLRRGLPTTHVKFGEGMALLAGDGLLSQAFEALLQAAPTAASSSAFLRACKIFSSCIGCDGMVAGQCVDITNNEDFSIEYLQLKKTSALLKCGLCCGAALGGASQEMLNSLGTYSDSVGLAFQITDDILDVVGDSSVIGKSIGKDKEQNKRTFTSKYGIDGSKLIAKDYIDNAINAIRNIEGNEFLTEFALQILNRDR